VSASGGVPKQLTWYPARGPLTPRWGWDNQVYGWTADGASILFRSMREGWDLTDTRLFTVPREGGPATALPMPVSGGGDISPNGKQVVYSPLTRDFRTWKRYEGGWAQDLYIYDLATAALTPVAHSKRTERDPMWIGDSIYFDSDRDGTLNLYAFDTKSGEVQQLTHETKYDVRWASKGDADQIVYELNGELHVFDTRARKDQKLDLRVAQRRRGDAARARERLGADRRDRPLAQGRARAGRGARRRLHGASEERRGAQPHAHERRP
jgi:tricorn protease